MVMHEEQLKQLILSVLKELEEERARSREAESKKKVYMVCSLPWDQRYRDFMDRTELSGCCQVVPVIPGNWQEEGYEAILRLYPSCGPVRYHADEMPDDLEAAVTVFPVTDRDTIVKTALGIGDTFAASWVAECMEQGARIVCLRSGLRRFSGREPAAFVEQIMSCYRKVLEYGIEICDIDDLLQANGVLAAAAADQRTAAVYEDSRPMPAKQPQRKKRVITAAEVERFAVNGMIHLQQGDIVTDLAKDRAKYLNLVFR